MNGRLRACEFIRGSFFSAMLARRWPSAGFFSSGDRKGQPIPPVVMEAVEGGHCRASQDKPEGKKHSMEEISLCPT
jgi:hypothetical protein